ncbi:MAG: hypothetical protein HY682_10520 [Chloroflexi bacterium]|nr:hypothetical protein [Chloroflexota bacterium]
MAGAVAEKVNTGQAAGDARSPRRKSVRQLLSGLRRRLVAPDADWMSALFETIAEWPLARETAFDREFFFLIDGEAFDWVALVERILLDPSLKWPADAGDRLLGSPGFPDEMSEAEFRRRIGPAKQRAYLNYFYGVVVEEALLLAVEEDIRKRRFSNGLLHTDARANDAFVHLYGATPADLLKEFRKERPGVGGSPRVRTAKTETMTQAAAFTYWLFKRRIQKADPARLASDTRKGLEQLQRMRAAQARRARGAGRTLDHLRA